MRWQAIVLGVDSHNDTLQRVLIGNLDIGNRLPDGTIDSSKIARRRNSRPVLRIVGADVLQGFRGGQTHVGLS